MLLIRVSLGTGGRLATGHDEYHVAQDIKRIHKQKALSPVILVQGDFTRAWPFIIADGYHRMCAACHVDEDSPVSAILVTP